MKLYTSVIDMFRVSIWYATITLHEPNTQLPIGIFDSDCLTVTFTSRIEYTISDTVQTLALLPTYLILPMHTI